MGNGRKIDVDRQISEVQSELRYLEKRRNELAAKLLALKREREGLRGNAALAAQEGGLITDLSGPSEKVSLFRSLFKGREGVFPKRFESRKTGKTGYAPCCRNEWRPGICQKPKVKCPACKARDFAPVTDAVIHSHLLGRDVVKGGGGDYVIGVYPMLADDTCLFLAVDFDKEEWMADAGAYVDACRSLAIPAALERSRSGNGGHVWILFDGPVPAILARKMGAFILTEAMDRRPELGFRSYDRF